MKTSLNLINALNESFEKEYKAKIAANKALKESEQLNETGEWDDNDEDMQLWLEGMRDSAEELAKEVNGEVKTVKGFDAYQGPFAIVNTPKHGDIEVWYDQEDDSGLSFNAKVAHVGWISGGIIQLAELLNLDEIPEDKIINESEKAKIKDEIENLEDKMKDSKISDLKSEDAKKLKDLEDKLEDETLTEEDKTSKKESSIERIKRRLAELKAKEDAKYTEITTKPEDFEKDGVTPKEKKLKEDEVMEITQTEPELDYVITDVTELVDSTDGDVQAPDIDAMLTMLGESFKEEYGDAIKINILSANLLENGSFALVDISTPQILKEFEEKNIYDAAVGKNLVLESDGDYYTFKVNSLNGTTRYSKRTKEPIQAIREWIETEFLSEAKAEKEAELAALKAKTEKETVENYINCRPELKQEVANIEMFIQLSKSLENKDEMHDSIQNRMYALAAEMPANIEITNKDDKYDLKFTNRDEIVEIIFGKEWVKETTPDNEVVGLKESYDQFNIGNIEVVYNPQTQECLYSIESADIHDKKINLSKVPSVETPYDTDTIIKDYIEKQYGPVPQEEPKEDNEEITVDVTNQDLSAPEETEVVEEADEIPTPEDMGIDTQPADNEESQPEVETGSAYFVKIRPGKAKAGIEDIRQQQKDGVVQQKSSYIVVEEVNLSAADFDEFTSDFSQPREFLENIKPLDRKNYAFNVVKVNGDGAPYSVLVDPTGFDYARYVAINDEV